MRTQIYGTFGPACKSKAVLSKMIECGLTGMRLNLSHSSLRESKSYVETYISSCKKSGVKPQILIDMQGPELRIENVDSERELKLDEVVTFGKGGIGIPQQLLDYVDIGDEVLLDDGKLSLAVICKEGEKIEAKAYGVTALMQPFVFNGEDLAYVRKILKEYDAEDIQIFAKIENRKGVSNLESIIPEADVIIIARGDLGNDMQLWELPKVQKQIEEACKKHQKPYIVVTQMLSSMEENSVPTRAEVSDIFHAVIHGAYGVMVTGETAVGKYPVEVIRYLANTAKEAEDYET